MFFLKYFDKKIWKITDHYEYEAVVAPSKLSVRLWALPLLSSIILPGSLIIPYLIALHYGHIDAWIPTITIIGMRSPEVIIFAMILNAVAFIYILENICRFFIVRSRVQSHSHVMQNWLINLTHFVNYIGFVTGLVTVVGTFIVANCEPPINIHIHVLGSKLAFIPAPVHAWIYTIAFLVCSKRPHLALIRIPLSMAITLSAVLFFHFFSEMHQVPRVKWNHPHAFLMRPRKENGKGGVFLDGSHPNIYIAEWIALFEWGIVLFHGLLNLTYIFDYMDYYITLPTWSSAYKVVHTNNKNDKMAV